MSENRLKAVFIIAFLIGNLVAFVHSLYALFFEANSSWLLSLIASATVLFVFLIHIGMGKRPRTSRNLPLLLFICTLMAILVVMFGSNALALIYTLFVSCLGSWAYVYWYSKLGRSTSLLKVGDVLPSLEFFQAGNTELKTGDLEHPLLVVFYRGNWCPLCTAQIKELAANYQKLAERGYRILMVSPQPQEETEKLAKQFEVPMLFCEDRDGVVAKQLGIFHERALPIGMEKMGYSADAVFPTVIITDKMHKIIWLDQTDNYRVRPEPEEFIRVIDNFQPA